MPCQRFRRGDQQHDTHHADGKSDPVCHKNQNQQRHTAELAGIAQLKAVLGIVRHRHKGHIHQHLRHQPAGLHGKIAQNQRTEHTEGITQRIGRIQRGELQNIHNKLYQQKLDDQGHEVFFVDAQKLQVLI